MKIFFDNKIFINQIYGGPSVYFINLIKNLRFFDCDIKLSSNIHLSNLLNHNKQNIGGFFLKLPLNEYFVRVNSFKNILHHFSYKSHLKYIDRFKPNIIHSTYYDKYFFDNTNCQKVITVFDLINEKFSEFYTSNNKFLPKKKILDKYDKIICISENTKNDLLYYYEVDEKKISVIHLGYPDKKKNLFKIDIKPYILFVGTRWKYKNFFNLIKAYNRNKNLVRDFNIVCFGGGKFTQEEKNEIKSLGLKNDKIIQIDGNDKLLHSYYKSASLFVYPTLYEGFGLPILESFLYDCPVACSKTSSLPEVAGSGAMYFDPKNIDNITDVLTKILYSNSKKEELVEKARVQLNKFSWKDCANKTLNFYKT